MAIFVGNWYCEITVVVVSYQLLFFCLSYDFVLQHDPVLPFSRHLWAHIFLVLCIDDRLIAQVPSKIMAGGLNRYCLETLDLTECLLVHIFIRYHHIFVGHRSLNHQVSHSNSCTIALLLSRMIPLASHKQIALLNKSLHAETIKGGKMLSKFTKRLIVPNELLASVHIDSCF